MAMAELPTKRPLTKADYAGKWDHETDVAIIGFGLAGMVTAMELQEQGEDYLVLEKAPEARRGGGTRASGQGMFQASDKEKLKEYQRNLNKPNVIPEDVLEAWAEEMVDIKTWMTPRAEEVGMVYNAPESPLTEHPEFPGSEAVEGAAYLRLPEDKKPPPPGMLAARCWETFDLLVRKRGIEVMWQTPAVELIQDLETREIIGVRALQAGKEIYVKARKGVVMCTGGFEANMQMLRDYYGIGDVYNLSSPYNTGDGIKMLLKVGADLWHMRNPTTTGGVWITINPPGQAPVFLNSALFRRAGSWIEVAKDGTRFYNETFHITLRHMHMEFHGGYIDSPHFQCLPVYLIFDEHTRQAVPIATLWMGWGANVDGQTWSEDNSVEVDKGWITRADTIKELAITLGLSPDVLRETVNRYNRYCDSGEGDPEYGRDPETMAPLKNPPYYGINLWPSVVTTTGGGRRDKEARVLDVDGNPIPRLYETGELGSTLANLYQCGSFLTECIVFGRVAARNVAAEQTWG